MAISNAEKWHNELNSFCLCQESSDLNLIEGGQEKDISHTAAQIVQVEGGRMVVLIATPVDTSDIFLVIVLIQLE